MPWPGWFSPSENSSAEASGARPALLGSRWGKRSFGRETGSDRIPARRAMWAESKPCSSLGQCLIRMGSRIESVMAGMPISQVLAGSLHEFYVFDMPFHAVTVLTRQERQVE